MSYINTSDIADLHRYQDVHDDSSVLWLEKAQSGKVSMEDIKDALAEFTKLFNAGMASKAEILTLTRAFPDSLPYTQAAQKQAAKDEPEPIVIGGPASVSLVDREGHLITTQALERAFKKFMKSDRTRNVMVLHSDVQIGWALPAYISKGGQIFKSGVNDNGLFFICELRDDTSIAQKVAEQIKKGMLKSYSIAGSATKVQNMTKGLTPYLQVDDMELAEVTVCEKGVNQGAGFEILKAEPPPDKPYAIKLKPKRESPPWAESDSPPGWEKKVPLTRKMLMHSNDDGTINFSKSFTSWMQKEKDPLTTKESFATLNNEAGRKAEHEQLLREYGFPSEQSFETMRYVPVVETETDDDGIPVHNLPPWVVNEAGEALGDRLDEDSPEYNKSAKAKARQKAGSAQKMFMDFMEKDMPTNKPLRYPSKPYGRPASTPAPVKSSPEQPRKTGRDKQETQINPKKDIEKDMPKGKPQLRGGKKNYSLNPRGKRGSKGAASTTLRPYMQPTVEPKPEVVDEEEVKERAVLNMFYNFMNIEKAPTSSEEPSMPSFLNRKSGRKGFFRTTEEMDADDAKEKAEEHKNLMAQARLGNAPWQRGKTKEETARQVLPPKKVGFREGMGIVGRGLVGTGQDIAGGAKRRGGKAAQRMKQAFSRPGRDTQARDAQARDAMLAREHGGFSGDEHPAWRNMRDQIRADAIPKPTGGLLGGASPGRVDLGLGSAKARQFAGKTRAAAERNRQPSPSEEGKPDAPGEEEPQVPYGPQRPGRLTRARSGAGGKARGAWDKLKSGVKAGQAERKGWGDKITEASDNAKAERDKRKAPQFTQEELDKVKNIKIGEDTKVAGDKPSPEMSEEELFGGKPKVERDSEGNVVSEVIGETGQRQRRVQREGPAGTSTSTEAPDTEDTSLGGTITALDRLSEVTQGDRGRDIGGFRRRREDKAQQRGIEGRAAMGRRDRVERHKHLGFNETGEGHTSFAQNPGHFGMAHHERREDTRTALSLGGDMSFEDHVKHFSHLVGSYPVDDTNGKAGDMMARVSVHLPEGMHHGTTMSRQEFEQHYNNGAVKVHAMPAYGHVDVEGHAANTIAHYGQRNHIPNSLKPPAEQTPGQGATGGEAAATGGQGATGGGGSAFSQLRQRLQGQPSQAPAGGQAPARPMVTSSSNVPGRAPSPGDPGQLGTQTTSSSPLRQTKPIQGSLLKMLRKAMGIRTRRTRQYANR